VPGTSSSKVAPKGEGRARDGFGGTEAGMELILTLTFSKDRAPLPPGLRSSWLKQGQLTLRKKHQCCMSLLRILNRKFKASSTLATMPPATFGGLMSKAVKVLAITPSNVFASLSPDTVSSAVTG